LRILRRGSGKSSKSEGDVSQECSHVERRDVERFLVRNRSRSSARKLFLNAVISFSQRQPTSLYLPSQDEVPGVVVKSQHPLRDRFVFEYGGLANDGTI
jgi:hypothetical protein